MSAWLPTFIVIGPGRSGTTMLYEAFKEHPGICMAKNTKETNFFTTEYQKGLDWYRSFFEHCAESSARGEVSNMYIYNPAVPQRIAKCVPNVKLITVLRNPVDRLLSVYSYRQRSGEIPAHMVLAEAATIHPDLITGNLYGDQLNSFLDYFPPERFLISFFDDLEDDPMQFIESIFEFIGVDKDFRPDAIHRRINPSANIRYSILAPVMRLVADTMRRWQMYYLLDRAKGSSLVRQAFFRAKPASEQQETIDGFLKRSLQEKLNPQIEQVERITGRDLAEWYIR